MIFTLTALAAAAVGFSLLCKFLTQMVTWILVCWDEEGEDLFVLHR
jgi:hypothetical protein